MLQQRVDALTPPRPPRALQAKLEEARRLDVNAAAQLEPVKVRVQHKARGSPTRDRSGFLDFLDFLTPKWVDQRPGSRFWCRIAPVGPAFTHFGLLLLNCS